MGGNLSKTRAPGSWTAPPTATGGGEEELGLETVTTRAPVPEEPCTDGYFQPEVRAALQAGLEVPLCREQCRDVLLSDQAVSDGMHAGHISRRASERDAELCGSELTWEMVPRDKETSWKPSCKIDSTGNTSASDRLSNFPQPCQESRALSQGCSRVPPRHASRRCKLLTRSCLFSFKILQAFGGCLSERLGTKSFRSH